VNGDVFKGVNTTSFGFSGSLKLVSSLAISFSSLPISSVVLACAVFSSSSLAFFFYSSLLPHAAIKRAIVIAPIMLNVLFMLKNLSGECICWFRVL
jgi:hypothetical protein